MTDWRKVAGMFPAQTFPIDISWDGSKWQKRPLTKNGHLDAQLGGSDGPWERANGFGAVMGDGLIALDVDDYKKASEARNWIEKWCVTMKTRTHTTVSGGAHLIFRVPEEFHDLRSGTNIVHGLDTRAAGGWIAFGEGYEVQAPRDPAWLTPAVCKELRRVSEGRRTAGMAEIGGYRPPEERLAKERLSNILGALPALARRWRGDRGGLGDRSRSAMDLSVAQLLGLAGFDANEIIWALMSQFEFGQARWIEKGGLRAAMRCAGLAIAEKTERDRLTDAAFEAKPVDPEVEAYMKRLMG